MNELYPKKFENFLQKMEKNEHFWGKSAKKYSKIEVIYVIKIPVSSKSIPKPRIIPKSSIPKSRFYCIRFLAPLFRFWGQDPNNKQ